MKLIILGAAALAREFYWHIKNSKKNPYKEFIFINDLPDNQLEVCMGSQKFPVVKNWIFDGPHPFIVAVGNPFIKKKLVLSALSSGLYPADTFVCDGAIVQDPDNKLGKGGLIAPGCILTTNITLDDYVTLNLNTTVGHDSFIGKYSTTNPGVHVSGNTNIGEMVEIGTGSIIRDYVSICSENLIGAQSAVVKDISDSRSIFAGVPAKKLKDLP